MATTGLSPFISAIRARQRGAAAEMVFHQDAAAAAQLVAPDTRGSPAGTPHSVALPALVIFSQTRARAASSVRGVDVFLFHLL